MIFTQNFPQESEWCIDAVSNLIYWCFKLHPIEESLILEKKTVMFHKIEVLKTSKDQFIEKS